MKNYNGETAKFQETTARQYCPNCDKKFFVTGDAAIFARGSNFAWDRVFSCSEKCQEDLKIKTGWWEPNETTVFPNGIY